MALKGSVPYRDAGWLTDEQKRQAWIQLAPRKDYEWFLVNFYTIKPEYASSGTWQERENARLKAQSDRRKAEGWRLVFDPSVRRYVWKPPQKERERKP